jgi:membrane protein insertase Oxa1/YidC/SpoIIIJ
MRLIYPEQKEHNEKITKLRKAGEMQLVRIENEKFSKYKESLGIRNNPLNFVLGLSQAAVLACWASLVMRFAYNVEDYPEMLTGGFFWFRDLSNIDPFFILPIINSTMLMLNIYTNNNTYSNVMMLKFRRYMFVMPFFSLPVMCTLETGIVLYFSVTSAITFLFQYVFLSQKMRTRLEVNNFYPGTKLEKLVSNIYNSE